MSFEWNDENKQDVIDRYKEAEPTPDTSMDVVNEIAEEIGATPNGVRMILMQADVYVKKTPATSSSKGESSGTKRVSKADAQDALRSAISAKDLEVDDDIIDKLTGKAAQYFAGLLEKL